eukprot:450637-Amphidinium_carterae.1
MQREAGRGFQTATSCTKAAAVQAAVVAEWHMILASWLRGLLNAGWFKCAQLLGPCNLIGPLAYTCNEQVQQQKKAVDTCWVCVELSMSQSVIGGRGVGQGSRGNVKESTLLTMSKSCFSCNTVFIPIGLSMLGLGENM